MEDGGGNGGSLTGDSSVVGVNVMPGIASRLSFSLINLCTAHAQLRMIARRHTSILVDCLICSMCYKRSILLDSICQ